MQWDFTSISALLSHSWKIFQIKLVPQFQGFWLEILGYTVSEQWLAAVEASSDHSVCTMWWLKKSNLGPRCLNLGTSISINCHSFSFAAVYYLVNGDSTHTSLRLLWKNLMITEQTYYTRKPLKESSCLHGWGWMLCISHMKKSQNNKIPSCWSFEHTEVRSWISLLKSPPLQQIWQCACSNLHKAFTEGIPCSTSNSADIQVYNKLETGDQSFSFLMEACTYWNSLIFWARQNKLQSVPHSKSSSITPLFLTELIFYSSHSVTCGTGTTDEFLMLQRKN